jgi:hypothetical protein
MIISKQKLDYFSKISFENFLRWIVTHIRRCFPQQYAALGDAQAEQWVRYGVTRARHYGLQGKRDICAFTDLIFIFGPHFDRSSWAYGILADHQLAPGLKAAMLLETANVLLESAAHAK